MRAAKRKPTIGPKRTSICLSAEAHKSLRIAALRREITMSQLIAQALADAGINIPPEDLEA
ncbi:hypothetical protein HYQ43_13935 [Paracoccus pantotrophus]|uniref:Uncharacterized protein n=1 Tax=Paracoccus pantotrophus TaxID=82367 RepID=A0A7H9BV86_PARPN|nr:hypothetical protein [Paracoccus pantotrophus]QLH15294.1 hypothetical protein HYQ43_13935 [Paracoccus pantotrophus]